MKITSAAYLLGLLAFCDGAAQAAENHNGRNLAAACSACHGTNGVSVGGMAALAGMDKTHMVNTMQEFKSGKRPATLMHQIAKGYSDEQIGQIAEFFAQQK